MTIEEVRAAFEREFPGGRFTCHPRELDCPVPGIGDRGYAYYEVEFSDHPSGLPLHVNVFPEQKDGKGLRIALITARNCWDAGPPPDAAGQAA